MNFTDNGIEGFDVSFYQDDNTTPQGVDFAKMKAWGADFVIVRAGQNVWVDQDFHVNWAAAKAAGLPRGAYWFYDPRIEPLKQAQLFYDCVKNDLPEGRLWIDLEFPTSWGGRYTDAQYWRVMCDELIRMSGLRIGIYTANWWWSAHVVNTNYFYQYPLWVAQYTTDPAWVVLPKGWTSALIWQDGTPPIGHDVGVESVEVDHNKFNGTAEQFNQEFGTAITVPPVTGGEMQKGTMYNFTVNVRTSAGAIVAALKLNDVVIGEVKGSNPSRIYFDKITRANGSVMSLGQICSAVTSNDAGTVQYMRLEPVTVTPPPVGDVVPFTLAVDGYKPVSGNLEPV